MTYNNLFVDSDTILDLLLQREPHSYHTQILFAESKRRELSLHTSALIIANLNYLLTKRIGKVLAKASLINLLQAINVLPFEADSIEKALQSSFTDFEDAIQHYIAKKYACNAIITRNIKDYKHSEIKALTAEQFLRTL